MAESGKMQDVWAGPKVLPTFSLVPTSFQLAWTYL